MAFRYPLYLTGTPVGIQEADALYMQEINDFAGYAFAQNPNPYIVTTGATGTLLANQPFVDTYLIAGTYVTRVDRYATEAETPNVSVATDNYSRVRQVTDTVAAPSGDANNHEYPLYLYNDGSGEDYNTQLRSMTLSDFYDTFVSPVLGQFGGGGTSIEKGGTFFMTTSASPTNGTILATPAAVNSVSDLAAYTSGGIPEAVKQTTDTTYYIAKVNPASTDFLVADELPLYWDYANGQIRAHTPTSWANLMNKFLRYYLSSNAAGPYEISYNIDGANGVANGTAFVDERRTPSGTGYTTRFVNADDYRTQEFPTGTVGTIGTAKQFKIQQGNPSATYAASSTPSGSINEGSSLTFTLTTTGVSDGTQFSYSITGINAGDITAGSISGTVTISSGTGSTSITLRDQDGIENETATCTFSVPGSSPSVSVTINDVQETINLEGTQALPEIGGFLPTSDGSVEVGWRFSTNGTVEDYNADRIPLYSSSGHVDWVNNTTPINTYYIRGVIDSHDATGYTTGGTTLNTWVALSSTRSFTPKTVLFFNNTINTIVLFFMYNFDIFSL